jgi:hypothetical protein
MKSLFAVEPRLLRSALGWAVCVALVVVVVAGSGCQTRQSENTPTQATNAEMPAPGPVPDPLAQQATIDDSGKVTPGTIHLSKGAGDRVQWKNTSHDTMMIILKDSHVAELVAPGELSASHRVCLDCMDGNYPYVIKRMVGGLPMKAQSGPPTEPQFSIGG